MRHFVIFNLPFGFYCLLSALKFTLYTSIHFEALTFSKRKLLGGAVHPRSSFSCAMGTDPKNRFYYFFKNIKSLTDPQSPDLDQRTGAVAPGVKSNGSRQFVV